jgi:hypothetical protein
MWIAIVASTVVMAGVLVFLGTSNIFLTILGVIVTVILMRIWWITERRYRAEKRIGNIVNSAGQLVSTINVLSLEIADLNIQVQALSNKTT